MSMPKNDEEYATLTEAEQAKLRDAILEVIAQRRRLDMPTTPDENTKRLAREIERTYELAKLARFNGLELGLYNHGGWAGMIENQVAIMRLLKSEVS